MAEPLLQLLEHVYPVRTHTQSDSFPDADLLVGRRDPKEPITSTNGR
jgi:hypothetical protein